MNPATDPNIQILLDRIVPAVNPITVYLFGSRARGTARPDSDYDLFLVVDDDTPRAKLQPQVIYPQLRDTDLTVDVIPCYQRTYQKFHETPGAMSYIVAREGIPVYERR